MPNLASSLVGVKGNSYQAKQDTATLIRAVAHLRKVNTLSGDEIWNLIRLTWISRNRDGVSKNHWKKLKIPALASLFGKAPTILSTLSATVDGMELPALITKSASNKTGIVNFRPTWRNSSRDWCRTHRKELRAILGSALRLGVNNQDRYELADRIEKLPGIKSPDDKADVRPGVLLSPLIACLDLRRRFPILNGRDAVTQILRKLDLAHSTFRTQVQGLIGIIGQFGITDALMLDTFSDQLAAYVSTARNSRKARQHGYRESPLRTYDLAEREAVRASLTSTYRKRHDRMTNALPRIFPRFKFVTQSSPAGRCDAFVANYDGAHRDLLIEAKPNADRGSIRIALGQLLDYRRYLKRQSAADLVFLTISRPESAYIELLLDLGITTMWFGNDSCKRIVGGAGTGWPMLKKSAR